jgi:hypothetical protein
VKTTADKTTPLGFARTKCALLPMWVFSRGLSSTAIHLYGWLAVKYSNAERECWPSQATLADDLRWSIRTIGNAIKELRDAGAIVTKRRHRADGSICGLEFSLPLDEAVHSAKSCRKATNHSAEFCRSPQQNFAEQEKRTIPIEPSVRTASRSVLADLLPTKAKKAKTKLGYGRHRDHVFCGDLFCIDREKHQRFEKRLVAAGENLAEHDLVTWYGARDHELSTGEETTTDHPALWLEKQFAESLKP